MLNPYQLSLYEATAILDETRAYRFRLERRWSDASPLQRID